MAVWKGSLTDTIHADIDKVWRLASDFGSILDWARPALEPEGYKVTCKMYGEPPEPGCVRVFTITSPEGTVTARETLVYFDAEKHLYKYTVEEHPMLPGYVSTFKLSNENEGTRLDWSYEMPAMEDAAKEIVLSDFVINILYKPCIQAMKNALT